MENKDYIHTGLTNNVQDYFTLLIILHRQGHNVPIAFLIHPTHMIQALEGITPGCYL